jgi:hypothetical protein
MDPDSWSLEKNSDGVNVYTDKKDVFKGLSKSNLSRSEAH